MDWTHLLAGFIGFIIALDLCARRAQQERKELTDNFWGAFERAVKAHREALDKQHENYQASLNRYDEQFRAGLDAARGFDFEPPPALEEPPDLKVLLRGEGEA